MSPILVFALLILWTLCLAGAFLLGHYITARSYNVPHVLETLAESHRTKKHNTEERDEGAKSSVPPPQY